MGNDFDKGTREWFQREDYISGLAQIPEPVRDAVIEKWLTYTKSENLTEFLVWRTHLMKQPYSRKEQVALKMCLRDRRERDKRSIGYRDAQGHLAKKMNRYGSPVDKIYPLLDPDLTHEARLSKHAVWFKDSTASTLFLTQGGAENEELVKLAPEVLGLKAPCILLFMPSKRVFHKLLERAMQIKDEISELNPHEGKFDPRKVPKQTEALKFEVDDEAVEAGVDPVFNALRVFPPLELNYPDIEADGDAFYDRIGCPHLLEKFKLIEMAYNPEILVPKPRFTGLKTKDRLQKIDWRMSDICPEDID